MLLFFVAGEPFLGVLEFVQNIVVVITPTIIFVAMGHKLIQSFFQDSIHDSTCSLGIHEVARINTALVDEHLQHFRILHHVPEQTGSWFGESPRVTVIPGIVNHVDGVGGTAGFTKIVETKSEVCILDNRTESLRQIYFRIFVGAPEHDVVAREVDIAVEEVQNHHVQILADINPLLVFSLGMTLLTVEILEGLIEDIVAFLQLLDEQVLVSLFLMRDLNLVHILKTVVVTVDIVFVGTLTDVEHTHIFAVDVENG